MLNAFQIAVLLDLPGIGKKSVEKINKQVNYDIIHPNELYDSIKILKKSNFITHSEFVSRYEKIEDLFEFLENNKIKTISLNDDSFPEQLSRIDDPPVILYVKGNPISLNTQPNVAVVGTRKPSNYGYQLAERVGSLLAQNNINVVSGLALGCDSAAHKGCIHSNGITIAVLAHGLNTIYPAANKQLANEIVESGGCLVTEYSFYQKAMKNFFVERDRLQSGLSEGTIIIETAIKGGTMHTVNFTLKQNRLLYALSHPQEKQSDKSNGNKHLIETKKAISLANEADINSLINNIKSLFNRTLLEEKRISSKIENEIDNIEKDNFLILNFEELAKRFKIKRIETIKKHLSDGTFSEWSFKKDPQKLKWNFDTNKNEFITLTNRDLFS